MIDEVNAAVQRNTYLEDTYAFRVRTSVIATGDSGDGGTWCAVRDNIAHPQGGGQPADPARLDDRAVTPRRQDTGDGTVLVVLALADGDGPSPRTGNEVDLVVDERARLRHAALHTAGHLIDASVRRRGYRHIVSNHFPDQARIEFVADEPLADPDGFVAAVQAELDDAIGNDLPVDHYYENDRRFVRIGDVSVDECAGTHLSGTAQITDAVVRSAKVKKGRLKVGYAAEHAAHGD